MTSPTVDTQHLDLRASVGRLEQECTRQGRFFLQADSRALMLRPDQEPR